MKKGYNFLSLKALEFFIENPYEEIYLREFARKLKISLNSTQRFVNLFVREKLIKEKRKANLRYLKANLDSIVFRNIKIVFSLKKIEDSGLIDLLREKIFHFVLFGSVAKGLDDFKSDIDFLVVGKNKEEIKTICFKKQNKFDKEVNFHIFTLSEWKKQREENKAFYQEIISTGINLIGDMPI